MALLVLIKNFPFSIKKFILGHFVGLNMVTLPESQSFKINLQREVQGLCDSADPGRGLGGHGPRPRRHRAHDEQAAWICQVRSAGERGR